MNEEEKSEKNFIIQRIGGYLHKVTPVVDITGKVVNNIVTPFQIELKPRDIFQIIVGAYILAIPVGFTEEVWILSENLPMKNIYYICGLSIFFISCFVYYNFYRYALKGHVLQYFSRVLATYGLSLVAVGLFLTIIQKCPWGVDNMLAIKRLVLVTFPASMAATISDTLK